MPYKDKNKQREYQRIWVAERRSRYFMNRVCIDCGSINKLELDHIDPHTKINHRIWSWSENRRNLELAKCVVRCMDCHNHKTVFNMESPAFNNGIYHPSSILTENQVIEIRALYNTGLYSYRELSTIFLVSSSTIKRVVVFTDRY